MLRLSMLLWRRDRRKKFLTTRWTSRVLLKLTSSGDWVARPKSTPVAMYLLCKWTKPLSI